MRVLAIAIGLSEALGGILGLIFLPFNGLASWPALTIFIWLIGLLLFLIGIAAGVLLCLKKPLGLKLSVLMQAVQVPCLFAPPITYTLVFGALYAPSLLLNIQSGDVYFQNRLQLGGELQMSFVNVTEFWGIGINVIALFFLWALVKKMPNKAFN